MESHWYLVSDIELGNGQMGNAELTSGVSYIRDSAKEKGTPPSPAIYRTSYLIVDVDKLGGWVRYN